MVQEDKTAGETHREIEVVQDRDHRRAVPRAPPRRLDEVDLMAQIEARGRLVQQQQARAMRGLAAGKLHQHAGKMRALLLAAGQRRELSLAEMRPVRPRAARHRPGGARWRGCVSPAPMSTISSTVNGKVTLTCCDSIARCRASSRGV